MTDTTYVHDRRKGVRGPRHSGFVLLAAAVLAGFFLIGATAVVTVV